jgi:hypothetical protein
VESLPGVTDPLAVVTMGESTRPRVALQAWGKRDTSTIDPIGDNLAGATAGTANKDLGDGWSNYRGGTEIASHLQPTVGLKMTSRSQRYPRVLLAVRCKTIRLLLSGASFASRSRGPVHAHLFRARPPESEPEWNGWKVQDRKAKALTSRIASNPPFLQIHMASLMP